VASRNAAQAAGNLAANLAAPAEQPAGWVQRFVMPSIADCAFVAVLFWLFFFGQGATALLGDGDTGWHIRTGEWVLAQGSFPREDLFSFSMQGRQWFAWEWFSDVLFAVLHDAWGLRALVLLAGVVIAATAAALLRYMIWQGANLLVAIVAMLAVCSASMVHWLARPHMFTWGLLLATVWLLEADRRRPSRRVWLLAPLVVVWVNTHGGFALLLVTLAIYAVGSGAEQLWAAWDGRDQARSVGRANEPWLRLPPALRRYGALFVVCCSGTLVNPYGWELHQHIGGYLQSDFILNNIQEFQSPNFRGESMRVFEVLLLLGLPLAGRLAARRELTGALLIAAFAHASLVSVRHVPLFMIVAAPLLAREVTLLIEQGARGGNPWLKILNAIAEDYGGRSRAPSESGPLVFNLAGLASVGVIAAMLSLHAAEPKWNAEFPAVRFPKLAADALKDRFIGKRLLSTDQWGDYLVYRFYPEFQTFIDGRSDFYDPTIRDEYLALMNGKWGWERILAKHDFEAALLPSSWALASTLKLDPGWRLVYDDGEALYFERAQAPGEAALGPAAAAAAGHGLQAAKN
jgi:hypothetical protein